MNIRTISADNRIFAALINWKQPQYRRCEGLRKADAGVFSDAELADEAMKILLCHNYYQEPGGEDQVFADEVGLLRSHGHEVVQYTGITTPSTNTSRVENRRTDPMESRDLPRIANAHSP